MAPYRPHNHVIDNKVPKSKTMKSETTPNKITIEFPMIRGKKITVKRPYDLAEALDDFYEKHIESLVNDGSIRSLDTIIVNGIKFDESKVYAEDTIDVFKPENNSNFAFTEEHTVQDFEAIYFQNVQREYGIDKARQSDREFELNFPGDMFITENVTEFAKDLADNALSEAGITTTTEMYKTREQLINTEFLTTLLNVSDNVAILSDGQVIQYYDN